ncbi:hypothetical protein FRC14_005052 [Serendipita sp. 396]|nr:hypothetical protein FRC14_005052 [Serendipita sp. 396]KAG8787430.1 hypothetical protein FRC15_009244 [Serendipita sp. 397]KAG8802772.1 hypothetical protein FRC16_008688 [Serendipita sp. 398]KAG8873094.1 hypothetical protein FRC20_008721 [Serendipita sp. 405]
MKFPVLLAAVSASFFAQSVVAAVAHVAREEVGIVPRIPAVYPYPTTTSQKPVSSIKSSTGQSSSTSRSECVTTAWNQCGGLWFTGCTKCPPDQVCVVANVAYSQCLPNSSSTSSSTTSKVISTSSTTQPSSTSKSECVTTAWNQCGGRTFTGCTKCPPDQVCVVANSDYAQCLPKSSSSSTSSKVTSTSTSSIPYPG